MGDTKTRLTGFEAIEYASKRHLPVSTFSTPIDSECSEITVEWAREIANEDPSLIYIDIGPEVETEKVGSLIRIVNAWACERCDCIFVGEYFSADHCNESGDDLVLCEDCCIDANEERQQGE